MREAILPGSRVFWQRAFEVHLSRIELPLQRGARSIAYDEWIPDSPVNGNTAAPAQGSIDAINENPMTVKPIKRDTSPSEGEVPFFKIDVEGYEEQVLPGTDLTSFRPWIKRFNAPATS